MRILMTSYEFPPIGGGGAAVVAGLARELVAGGHEIDLVTMSFQEHPRHEVVDGIHVHRVPCLRRTKHNCTTPEAFSYVAGAMPAILRLVNTRRYDLVHAHFILPDGLLAWQIKRYTGLPFIITAHGTDVPGYNQHRLRIAHRLVRPVWRAVVEGADRVVCPSEVLQRLVLAQRPAPHKTIVIPNGLQVAEYTPRAQNARILVVTRMLERKGVQYVLDALAQTPVEPEVHIVGDGPYLPELRAKADALRSPARFWGWLDNRSPQLREIYESSGIFVFPSEAENFPMVLLEAMAAGLAIITSEGTGCAEVVGDAGILVPVRDSRAIGRALKRLVDDPELRRSLGAAARRRVEENFTWSAVAARYVEEYARQAGSGGPPKLVIAHSPVAATRAEYAGS
ncbi:MAG: glycosyltransferase family 4 protein [Gemmatimonadota bacterium]|nr:glycosyltransferase family 4 protein [Gemmatimonadota bacterium]